MRGRTVGGIVVTALALALLLPLAAGAETTSDRPAAAPRPRPVQTTAVKAAHPTRPSAVAPAQKIIFTDDEVTADREGGAGEVVTVRQPLKHSNMIKIRAHFLPELLKSAEDV